MEKRYKIIILLLVIIVVILSGIIIFLVTRPVSSPEIKLTNDTVVKTESSTNTTKSQSINILGKYTASFDNSAVKLTKNDKGEVIEISNILGDTSKGLVISPQGLVTNYVSVPVTINFYNEEPKYPSEDLGFFKQPDTSKIVIDGNEYVMTWYSNGEGASYGEDGISLGEDLIKNCPHIKYYATGNGEIKKYLNLSNSVYVEISFNEYSELNSKSCILTDNLVTEKTLELVDKILKSMKKI